MPSFAAFYPILRAAGAALTVLFAVTVIPVSWGVVEYGFIDPAHPYTKLMTTRPKPAEPVLTEAVQVNIRIPEPRLNPSPLQTVLEWSQDLLDDPMFNTNTSMSQLVSIQKVNISSTVVEVYVMSNSSYRPATVVTTPRQYTFKSCVPKHENLPEWHTSMAFEYFKTLSRMFAAFMLCSNHVIMSGYISDVAIPLAFLGFACLYLLKKSMIADSIMAQLRNQSRTIIDQDQRVSELTIANSTLEQSLQILDTEKGGLQNSLEEVRGLLSQSDDDKTNLQNEIGQVKEQLENVKSGELQELRDRIEISQKTQTDAEELLRTKEVETKKVVDQSAQRKTEDGHTITKLTEELEESQARCRRCDDELDAQKLEAKKEEEASMSVLQDLKSRLDELQKQYDNVQHQLTVANSRNEQQPTPSTYVASTSQTSTSNPSAGLKHTTTPSQGTEDASQGPLRNSSGDQDRGQKSKAPISSTGSSVPGVGLTSSQRESSEPVSQPAVEPAHNTSATMKPPVVPTGPRLTARGPSWHSIDNRRSNSGPSGSPQQTTSVTRESFHERASGPNVGGAGGRGGGRGQDGSAQRPQLSQSPPPRAQPTQSPLPALGGPRPPGQSQAVYDSYQRILRRSWGNQQARQNQQQ